MSYLPAKIITSLTTTANDRVGFANLLLSLITPEVKGEYGIPQWTFQSACRVAGATATDSNPICVYAYHFEDVGEGEDFYTGQTLVGYQSRTDQHDRNLALSLEDLEKRFAAIPAVPIM